jgi:hypothetical protein
LLKTCKKPKRNTSHLSVHTRHGPHHSGPHDPPEGPSQRLPRAGSASLEGPRLPRAGSASLEGSSPPRSRPPHEHTRSRTRVWAFNALTQQSRAIMRLGITPRRCSANSLGGNPSLPLWGTVRHGQCQPRGTAPPTPVWITRRALEGGPATPSNRFLVNLQGQTITLSRRDAIPAIVGPVRPPPCLQHHAGHCYNNSGAVRHAGTGRRHACHCIPYASPSTASSSPSEDATANHYALTLEAATVRAQDAP